jgi:hypothetical protein
MPQPSLSNQLLSQLADGIDDVRQKVVEEGFFGREVTEDGPAMMRWPDSEDVSGPGDPAATPAQDFDHDPAPQAPPGMSGDILPPEPAQREAFQGAALEQDKTIDGYAEQIQGFLGNEPEPGHDEERDAYQEMDRDI